jgi:rod shape-determining protein MreD
VGFLIRSGGFILALFLDASGLFRIPYIGGQPLLFVARSVCYGLGGTALRGGGWGFTGGMALGLLFSPERMGILAFAGLLAGAVPTALRGLFFWERWTGQLILGAMAGILFGLTRVIALALLGELERSPVAFAPALALDAALTAAVCPFIFWVTRRLRMGR